MSQQFQNLFLEDMTMQKMYKIFGLQKIRQLEALEKWLSNLPELNKTEKIIGEHYQSRLLENIEAWNEQELSLHFIVPIFAAIDFTVPYRINLFAQRQISAQIDNYLLAGKPDGMIASGFLEPEIPFFCFQEFETTL